MFPKMVVISLVTFKNEPYFRFKPGNFFEYCGESNLSDSFLLMTDQSIIKSYLFREHRKFLGWAQRVLG
jgi:hypothetical protein